MSTPCQLLIIKNNTIELNLFKQYDGYPYFIDGNGEKLSGTVDEIKSIILKAKTLDLDVISSIFKENDYEILGNKNVLRTKYYYRLFIDDSKNWVYLDWIDARDVNYLELMITENPMDISYVSNKQFNLEWQLFLEKDNHFKENVTIELTDNEYSFFKECADKCGKSVEEYISELIVKCVESGEIDKILDEIVKKKKKKK